MHIQESGLLFTPAEVPVPKICCVPATFFFAKLCSKMWVTSCAQLEVFAEDEVIDVVPNFQLRDLVNDDMLIIDAVRHVMTAGNSAEA